MKKKAVLIPVLLFVFLLGAIPPNSGETATCTVNEVLRTSASGKSYYATLTCSNGEQGEGWVSAAQYDETTKTVPRSGVRIKSSDGANTEGGV
jgi:hypothetical protein